MNDNAPTPRTITIDGRTVTTPTAGNLRLALSIWGDSGSGKTTLAATAPGDLLWMLFDPDGALSLVGRNDVFVLDLSGDPYGITKKFEMTDPFGITKTLKENPTIQTIVVDSLTAYTDLALQAAVAATNNSSLEVPGIAGYARRNTVMRRMVNAMLRLTKQANKHIVFITHEAAPTTDSNGRILHIGMALNEGAANNLSMLMSETWHLSSDEKGHKIAVRPCNLRKPMKTRMFVAEKASEFPWHYNPDTGEGGTIKAWFEQWRAANGARIPFPK